MTEPYQPKTSLPAKVKRRLTQWRTAKPLAFDLPQALISFTFDDFPRSAADTGADILERFDAKGCYYAATGMAGQDSPSGPIFDERDIGALEAAGHEIAAHTQTHLDCAQATPAIAAADIARNLDELRTMGATRPIRQFAYPYGETTTALKRKLRSTFTGARGILPGLNTPGNDAMQLRAVELDADPASLERAGAAIETALQQKAWLIFFTHDVANQPSDWGVTPQDLTRLVRHARDGGAKLTTPSHAFELMERQSA